MKKLVMILLAVLALLTFTGCQDVNVGEVGVKVFKLGGPKGETQVLGTGQYWMGYAEKLFVYPTTQHQYTFTEASTEGSPADEAFRFTAKGGAICTVDINVIAHADPSKADVLYKTWRTDMNTIIKNFVRQDIREALADIGGQYSVDDLIDGKQVELIKKVGSIVTEKNAGKGLEILSISLANNIRFDESVNQSIKMKIQAQQDLLQRQAELAKAEAEAKIKVTNAEAEAAANKAKMLQITPQLIEYERVQNEKAAIAKWDGTLPTTTLGSSVPFVNIK